MSATPHATRLSLGHQPTQQQGHKRVMQPTSPAPGRSHASGRRYLTARATIHTHRPFTSSHRTTQPSQSYPPSHKLSSLPKQLYSTCTLPKTHVHRMINMHSSHDQHHPPAAPRVVLQSVYAVDWVSPRHCMHDSQHACKGLGTHAAVLRYAFLQAHA
jgi:hypothetical protein